MFYILHFIDGADKEVKRHRKRKKHKRSSFSQKDESIAESNIIQCMLSPPEALLRYSLWIGNLEQAAQIIKVRLYFAYCFLLSKRMLINANTLNCKYFFIIPLMNSYSRNLF